MTNNSDETGEHGPTAPKSWGEPRTRILRWHDPEQTLAAASGLSGLDHIRGMAAGTLPPPPLAGLIDMRITAVEHGEVRLGSTADESLLNLSGIVAGGVLCTLMDTVTGLAVRTTLPPGQAVTTIELKVSFLRPMIYDGREVSLVGTVLKRGRRVAFAEGHAYSPDGELIGHSTVSLAVIKARRSERGDDAQVI